MSTEITVVRDKHGLIKRAMIEAPAAPGVDVATIRAIVQEVTSAFAKFAAPSAPSAPSGYSLAEAQTLAQRVADAVSGHLHESYKRAYSPYLAALENIEAGLAAGRFEITFSSGRRFRVTATEVR
jgi:hypothetical protein